MNRQGILAGKAVVVTGAGRGLGRAYAAAIAAAGGSVIVNDIDRNGANVGAEAIQASGGRAEPDNHDVTDWSSAEALVAHCVDAFGRIDGLVNNAGIFRIGGAHELDEADWRATFEVNVLGTAFCGTHAIRAMTRQGFGAIINVTSGSHAGDLGEAAYGASKGAVASMTYAWAIELAGTGIRVNAISPLAETHMAAATRTYFESKGQQSWLAESPAASDMAPLVVHLLSDETSQINGQVVRFDGAAVALVTHPCIADPRIPAAAGDSKAIGRALEELARHQLPLGLHRDSGA